MVFAFLLKSTLKLLVSIVTFWKSLAQSFPVNSFSFNREAFLNMTRTGSTHQNFGYFHCSTTTKTNTSRFDNIWKVGKVLRACTLIWTEHWNKRRENNHQATFLPQYTNRQLFGIYEVTGAQCDSRSKCRPEMPACTFRRVQTSSVDATSVTCRCMHSPTLLSTAFSAKAIAYS